MVASGLQVESSKKSIRFDPRFSMGREIRTDSQAVVKLQAVTDQDYQVGSSGIC